MMEEGVVVRLNKDKKFCFIEREGKEDLHCSIRYIPDVEDGDRVEFEEEETRDGRRTARKVKITKRADGSAYIPGKKTNELQEIDVDIEVGNPHIFVRTIKKPLEDFVEETLKVPQTKPEKERLLGLAVDVVLSRGGRPVPNQEVKLDADGKPVVQGMDKTLTLKDGKAHFHVTLPTDSTTCLLTAHIGDKPYSKLWEKEPKKKEEAPLQPKLPQTTTPVEPTEPPKITRTGISKTSTCETSDPLNGIIDVISYNLYTFEISGSPNANIDVKGEVEVEVRDVGCNDSSWTKPPFQLGTDGKAAKELRVPSTSRHKYGRIRFCEQDKQSNREFVSNS